MMRRTERLLLYVTALVLVGLLFFDGEWSLGGNPTADSAGRTSRTALFGTNAGLQTFELTDERGNSRVEIQVDETGTARLVLKNRVGKIIVSLGAGPGDTGEILLRDGKRSAGLRIQDNGDLTLVLDNNLKTGLFATASKNGSVEVTLQGIQGAHTRLMVSNSGETEVSVGSGPDGIEALLRTDREGAAEVALRNDKAKSETSMSILPNGDMSVRIIGGPGKPKAVMQLFQDGLAEIAIQGDDSKSGPQMVRLANGVSAVSTRLPDGTPGASMVSSPTGVSVVNVTSKDGRSQASLRIDADGKPGVLVTEPEPEEKKQPDKE
jgi:hypothetical protein